MSAAKDDDEDDASGAASAAVDDAAERKAEKQQEKAAALAAQAAAAKQVDLLKSRGGFERWTDQKVIEGQVCTLCGRSHGSASDWIVCERRKCCWDELSEKQIKAENLRVQQLDIAEAQADVADAESANDQERHAEALAELQRLQQADPRSFFSPDCPRTVHKDCALSRGLLDKPDATFVCPACRVCQKCFDPIDADPDTDVDALDCGSCCVFVHLKCYPGKKRNQKIFLCRFGRKDCKTQLHMRLRGAPLVFTGTAAEAAAAAKRAAAGGDGSSSKVVSGAGASSVASAAASGSASGSAPASAAGAGAGSGSGSGSASAKSKR